MNRSYEITILGNKFTLLTDLTEDEFAKVEAIVKKKLMRLAVGLN